MCSDERWEKIENFPLPAGLGPPSGAESRIRSTLKSRLWEMKWESLWRLWMWRVERDEMRIRPKKAAASVFIAWMMSKSASIADRKKTPSKEEAFRWNGNRKFANLENSLFVFFVSHFTWGNLLARSICGAAKWAPIHPCGHKLQLWT